MSPIFLLINMTMSFAEGTPLASLDNFYHDLDQFQASSVTTAAARANLEAARDRSLAKNMFLTPDLSLSFNKLQSNGSASASSESTYATAEANFNLFRGGRDLALMQQASSLKEAQTLNFRNHILQTETTAAGLIFRAVYLKSLLRVQEETFRLKEQSLGIMRDRYRQGKTPLQEAQKAEVETTQQESRVRLAKLAVLENASLIQGQFVDKIRTQDWPLSTALKLKVNSSPSLTTIAKLWAQKAAEFSYRAAHRAHWPSLDLNLQYSESPLPQRDAKQWTSMLTLRIPLWTKYETSAEISSQYSSYLQAQAEYQAAARADELRAELLQQKIEIATQNVIDAKSNLEKAKTLYQAVLRSFQIGRLSTNDLFIEQNRLLEVESALADNQLRFHETVLEVCTLKGLRAKECL